MKGCAIKRWRTRLGISQIEFSRCCRMHQSTLSKFETDSRSGLRLATVILIVEATRVLGAARGVVGLTADQILGIDAFGPDIDGGVDPAGIAALGTGGGVGQSTDPAATPDADQFGAIREAAWTPRSTEH